MDIQKVKAGEITAEIIDQQGAAWKQAVEDAKTASTAYMQDLESRKAALANRAAEYRKEVDDLHNTRKMRAAEVNDLTSRGRFDEAAEVEVEVEKLDATISMLERKLRLINSAEMRGDADCYEAAKQAHEKAEALRNNCIEALSLLHQSAQTEVSRLKAHMNKISNLTRYVQSYGPDDGFHKVDQHFRDLDRIEREAHEKWQAEQAEVRAATNHGREPVVIVPRG